MPEGPPATAALYFSSARFRSASTSAKSFCQRWRWASGMEASRSLSRTAGKSGSICHRLSHYRTAGREGAAARRAGEVEAELLLLGEADERPVVGELPAVAVLQLVEDDPASLADEQRMLE